MGLKPEDFAHLEITRNQIRDLNRKVNPRPGTNNEGGNAIAGIKLMLFGAFILWYFVFSR